MVAMRAVGPVVEIMTAHLREAFPKMTGFSARNVWDMRRLYSERPMARF